MNGADAVVFTAGIGENTSSGTGSVDERNGFFGIRIDPEKNKVRAGTMDISTPDAKVRTLVIPTNEELAIARETLKLTAK
jgi:acetate kinase